MNIDVIENEFKFDASSKEAKDDLRQLLKLEDYYKKRQNTLDPIIERFVSK